MYPQYPQPSSSSGNSAPNIGLKSDTFDEPPAVASPAAGAPPSVSRTRRVTASSERRWNAQFDGHLNTSGSSSPSSRKRVATLSSSVRTRTEIHAGHLPQRARKRQTWPLDAVDAAVPGDAGPAGEAVDAAPGVAGPAGERLPRPLEDERRAAPFCGRSASLRTVAGNGTVLVWRHLVMLARSWSGTLLTTFVAPARATATASSSVSTTHTTRPRGAFRHGASCACSAGDLRQRTLGPRTANRFASSVVSVPPHAGCPAAGRSSSGLASRSGPLGARWSCFANVTDGTQITTLRSSSRRMTSSASQRRCAEKRFRAAPLRSSARLSRSSRAISSSRGTSRIASERAARRTSSAESEKTDLLCFHERDSLSWCRQTWRSATGWPTNRWPSSLQNRSRSNERMPARCSTRIVFSETTASGTPGDDGPPRARCE